MGGKPRRVIVTRPTHDAAHWVDQLAGYGFQAQALPLIEIGPATDPVDVSALRTAWDHLDDYAACMFVSGNAVQYFFQQKEAAGHVNKAQAAINDFASAAVNVVPDSVRFLAPGPGTAAALQAAGVPADQVDSPPAQSGQFDSEALWRVVGDRDWRGRRILVLSGKTHGSVAADATGREWLSQQFLAAGARVERVSVYQRSAPLLTDDQTDLLRRATQDGSVWLFSSSEALANLLQQPRFGADGTALEIDWQHACAIATHPRIVQSVRAAGWGMVRESRPTLTDIVDALRSIESEHHE